MPPLPPDPSVTLGMTTAAMSIRGRLQPSDRAIVQITLPNIAPTLDLGGDLFTAKSEFHVTLVGHEILRRSGFLALPNIRPAIIDAARGLRFFVDLGESFRIVREEEACTIVRMCEVEGAEEFYRRLEWDLGGPVVRPPHHVTLYTLRTAKGIGIASADDLERMSRPLTETEQHELMRAIA